MVNLPGTSCRTDEVEQVGGAQVIGFEIAQNAATLISPMPLS
jgi:hypothetical protein